MGRARVFGMKFVRHIGRQGVSFIFLGMMALLAGARLRQPLTTASAKANLSVVDFIPLPFWGGVWTTVGVLLILAAFARPLRRWAAAGLETLALFFAITYFLAQLFVEGTQLAWFGAGFYIFFAFFTWILAGWQENER